MLDAPAAYAPAANRYHQPDGWFRRCGTTGLKLPAISLGFWQNFGRHEASSKTFDTPAEHDAHCRKIVLAAFDRGVTHLDFANNYGPPPGSAEARVGEVLERDLAAHRNELVITSKAGYDMWPGPYGDGGSRKYLIQSCEDSLRRLRVDHLDVFYHHRPDPETPMAESLGALDSIVRSGKALYCGVSNYSGEQVDAAMRICDEHGYVKPVVLQNSYSMLARGPEADVLPAAERHGLGVVAFSPLRQGLLTDKYLGGVPSDSRASDAGGTLPADSIDAGLRDRLNRLNAVASDRGQTLAQLALRWVLRTSAVTTALIGVSRVEQLESCVATLEGPDLSDDELDAIDALVPAD